MKHEILHHAAIRLGAMALVALGVAACGGGGGGASLGGIDRLGVSTGTVTGFGSIFVNGVEWETADATITVDDNPGTESDLRVGQVVTVRGELNSAGTAGTADSVEFDNSLEGPIASISLAAGTFVVLGQTVVTSADTQFDDSIPDRQADGRRTLEDLAEDDVVEVSGYRDAAGAVRATRVEIRAGAGSEYEVKGVVSSLNPGTSTFNIGTLQVNYAGAALEDFGSDTLSNGDFVEVEGTVVGNLLTASKVELEDDLGGDDGDSGELEGLVTSFTSITNFQVNGVPVTTNGGTEYERGTSANLVLNARVEVEGEFNASGVLVADKIEFRIGGEDADVEIAGTVDTVNVGARTVTVEGLDVVIEVVASTRLEDDSDSDEGNGSFALSELVAGDYVEVRGAEDTTGSAANDVIATRIERKDPDDEVVLQGPVQSESVPGPGPDLTILGVTVATDFAAVFRDENNNALTEAEFFGLVGIGDVVKARAAQDNVSGNILIAEEVEIEELD